MLTLGNLRYTQQKLRSQSCSLSEAFALRWLESEHAMEYERALIHTALGHSHELGVHGFFVDEGKGSLIVLICNPSKHVSEFSDSLQQFVKVGMQQLFAMPKPTGDDPFAAMENPGHLSQLFSRFALQFQAELEESKRDIKNINLRLVFFGDAARAANEEIVANFREDVVHTRPLVEARLERTDIEVTCTVKSADGSSSIPDRLKGYRQTISMADHVRTEGPNGELMHVGTVSLKQLVDMYRKLGMRFLARNVRAALPIATGSNQALSKAFLAVARGQERPEFFRFRHNGVTLTSTACEPKENALELVEPQLLNGAQTVTTLSRICAELKKRSEYSHAVESRLGQISVIGRVITNATREFITSVTIASNRQNPIMPWHLRAHDDIQSRLQAWFKDHTNLYYEVQEGAFDKIKEADEDIAWHGVIETDHCVNIKKLAQTFLATEGLVDKMQQLKAVFEEDSIYERVFCDGRMTAKPEDVVFCYKIERRIGKVLRLLGGTEKYAFVKSGRSLIWALLCQAYMNDSSHDRLAREHTKSLRATQEFVDAIERLATSRVKPLLMWIVNESSEYMEDVRTEKYGFLGTKKVFERTIDVAREKWGWQHRRLGTSQ